MVTLFLGFVLRAAGAPRIEVAGRCLGSVPVPAVVTGDAPHLAVRGLAPGEEVALHAFRSMSKQVFDAKWTPSSIAVPLHAWAIFRADWKGEVDLDRVRPLRGSYRSASPQGLLWSGYPANDPALPDEAERVSVPPSPPSASVDLVVEVEGRTIARGTLMLSDEAPDTAFETVDLPGLNGVFAFPEGKRNLPTVISLHGSEGGSWESARLRAAEFAARGFACFALNYFAYESHPLRGVPKANINTPVEMLQRTYDWLATRPEANRERLGVIGVSKGAEFALVGASRYDWVKAAAAIVPSDVVWEGYGGPQRPEGTSSWSVGGRPLPYVPLFDLDPKRFRLNTDRYEASRQAHPVEAKAAEIPVERSAARFLLIGSDRDETWASGRQVRRLVARLERAGRGRNVERIVFPKAGHFLSGTGAFPGRLYGVPSTDPRDKDLTAEGEAAESSWYRTVDFFRKSL